MQSRPHRPLQQHCSRPWIFDWLLFIYSFQFRSAFRAASPTHPSSTHSWTHLRCS